MNFLLALSLISTVVISTAGLAWPQENSADLTARSLEDLMNIEVTSVSKKEQKLSQTASAIFVITTDEIKRSGARTIPDLLRMVPGMDVAQISSNVWAISARGFNGEFADKLLVMVDGRSVFLPTFSGVFWDTVDLPFEDIERIEVIRGPGGTIWGANAVNGVINIITKNGSETRGGLIVAEGGNLTHGAETLQYGGNFRNTNYRIFTRHFDQSHLPGLVLPDGQDQWHLWHGGFRSDSRVSAKDDLTVEGDLYTGYFSDLTHSLTSFASPIQGTAILQNYVGGGFLQTDWNRRYSASSETKLQISFDDYARNDNLREERKTINIDFQHRFAAGTRHDFVWGVDYRYSVSATGGNLRISLIPPDRNTNLYSAFIQDEMALIPDRLALTIGTKLEHNYYTGFGAMPSARVAWTVRRHHTVWGAVSRALDTPSAVDASINLNVAGFFLPNGTPAVVRVLGNPKLLDETLLAYEAGYRAQLLKSLSLDIAAYFNSYSQVASLEPAARFLETTPGPPHLVVPSMYENLIKGNTRGVETALHWKVNERWTLAPAYAFQQFDLSTEPRSLDTQTVNDIKGSSPQHWARLGSDLKLFRSLSWDASGNFVGRLKSQGIPSYVRADSQLTWSAGESLSFSLVGQNLLRDRHLEFSSQLSSALSGYMKRSAYAKLTWTF